MLEWLWQNRKPVLFATAFAWALAELDVGPLFQELERRPWRHRCLLDRFRPRTTHRTLKSAPYERRPSLALHGFHRPLPYFNGKRLLCKLRQW